MTARDRKALVRFAYGTAYNGYAALLYEAVLRKHAKSSRTA